MESAVQYLNDSIIDNCDHHQHDKDRCDDVLASCPSPSSPSSSLSSLTDVADAVEEIFKKAKGGVMGKDETEKIFSLTSAYAKTQAAAAAGDGASSGHEWDQYVFFNDVHYTRNLVARTPHFEMILLCWNQGQASRIHSHSGSECWMTVLDGHIEEDLYSLKDDKLTIPEITYPSSCPDLVLERSSVFSTGDATHINDSVGLHRVKAPEAHTGITLHIYSPPIDEARLFEPNQNTSTRRPGYFSKFGKKT
eukprot:TRINITY_DN14379_c0_g1_i1.p1 TRINITY_DN14379_c0_g1~~TRINITY_DN14379_c0_g1_i1.p1  ORF type:complete len:283 (+),score=58.95 TRINITY_DN14379_c0_g1_i1:100-849(+)